MNYLYNSGRLSLLGNGICMPTRYVALSPSSLHVESLGRLVGASLGKVPIHNLANNPGKYVEQNVESLQRRDTRMLRVIKPEAGEERSSSTERISVLRVSPDLLRLSPRKNHSSQQVWRPPLPKNIGGGGLPYTPHPHSENPDAPTPTARPDERLGFRILKILIARGVSPHLKLNGWGGPRESYAEVENY